MGIIIALLLLAIIVGLVMAYRFQLFYKPHIGGAAINSHIMVFQRWQGDCAELNNIMSNIQQVLKAADIDQSSRFNVNLQQGTGYEFDGLAGCLITKDNANKIPAGTSYEQAETILAQAYIVSFPYTEEGSIELSVKKAYWALKKYIQELNLDTPIMQVLDDSENQIKYIAFLEPKLQYSKFIQFD